MQRMETLHKLITHHFTTTSLRISRRVSFSGTRAEPPNYCTSPADGRHADPSHSKDHKAQPAVTERVKQHRPDKGKKPDEPTVTYRCRRNCRRGKNNPTTLLLNSKPLGPRRAQAVY